VTSDFLRAPLHVLPDDSGCVIDCDSCTVRGAACDDCVVSVMLGGPPGSGAPALASDALPALPSEAFPALAAAAVPAFPTGALPAHRADATPVRPADPAPAPGPGNVVAVDAEARRALAVLADAGVVPPLRMTRPAVPPTPGPT
jgi:hypothetical protein